MAYKQTLPIGTMLNDNYLIESVLGSGGFANTYLASEVKLHRKVAIKEFFPSELAVRHNELQVVVRTDNNRKDYEWARDRFVKEAITVRKFNRSANIVRVYRTFDANNTAYIVLEYIDGLDFEVALEKRGDRPSQAELDHFCTPMLDALELVHSEGILHRDVKPRNIVLRQPDDDPVLIDFGAAKYAAGSASRTTHAIVSHGYSPQEAYAATSRQQGPWTDIYGLAATLYRAIQGQPPLASADRVLHDTMVPASKLDGAAALYRATFLESIEWGMAVRPGDRPKSIAEWRPHLLGRTDALPQWQRESTGTTSGRPGGRSRPSGRVPQTGPGVPAAGPGAAPAQQPAAARGHMGMMLTALLLLGGGAGLFTWQMMQPAGGLSELQRLEAEARLAQERLTTQRQKEQREAAEAQRKREEEQRLAAAAEAERLKAEADRKAAEAEAQRQRKEEQDRQAEALRKREEEQRLAAAADAQRLKEEADRRAAEAAAQRQREEEQRRQAELRRQEEARRQAEAEAQRKREEEQRLAAAADAQRLKEEADRRAAEAAAQRQREEEQRRQAEAEAQRRQEEQRASAAAEEERRRALQAASRASQPQPPVQRLQPERVALPRIEAPRWETLSATGNSRPLTAAALSPDGAVFAAGTDNGQLRLWRSVEGTEIGTARNSPLNRRIVSIAFGPTGSNRLASAGVDGTVIVWDTQSNRPLQTVQGGSNRRVAALGFDPRSARFQALVVTRRESRVFQAAIETWSQDGAAGPTVAVDTGGQLVTGAVFALSGDTLAIATKTERGGYGVLILDGRSGERLSTAIEAAEYTRALALSPDGGILAFGGQFDHIAVWDLSNPRQPRALKAVPLTGVVRPGIAVTALAFSPDGRFIASGGEDAKVNVWEVEAGSRVGDEVAGAEPAWLSFLPVSDGRRAVVFPTTTGTAQLRRDPG